MPDKRLRVLIVEDQNEVSTVIQRVLETLKPQFPVITFEKTDCLSKALEIVRAYPPPDLVTLDLGLKDSGRENTMAHVREIEAICPVVLVTGRTVDGFEDMLRELQIDVISKGQRWMADGQFIKACAKALMRGAERETAKMRDRIGKLQDLHGQLVNLEHSPSNDGA